MKNKQNQKSLLVHRAAAKKAARREDSLRLNHGVDPEVLQRENSIFPEGFFKNARISNLSEAVGR